jgi:hypothetical protein
MSTSATSTTSSIIARGVFTAAGVDHPGRHNVDTFVFPGGSFKVTHAKTSGSRSFNPKTCLMTINQRGTYKLSGGTGKYAGISGSGKYQLSILGVGASSAASASSTSRRSPFSSSSARPGRSSCSGGICQRPGDAGPLTVTPDR